MFSLRDVLREFRPVEIIDVGSNPVNGEPPYQPLLEERLGRVTGFEPEPRAFANLAGRVSDIERHLPYALGDGHTHELRVCWGDGMASLLEPDQDNLALFNHFPKVGEVTGRFPIVTKRLDDVDEIEHVDFLKMDVQGSELSIMRHGRQKLARTVMVQLEVSFITLYEGQPPFGEVDSEMRSMGFIPHCFTEVKKWGLAPTLLDGSQFGAVNQLLEADIVYARDFSRLDLLSDEQLAHMALSAHYAYNSYDLVVRLLGELESRGVVPSQAQHAYLDAVSSGSSQQFTVDEVGPHDELARSVHGGERKYPPSVRCGSRSRRAC